MPLLWISLAFVCGLALSSIISLPTWVWFGLSVIFMGIGALETLLNPQVRHPLLSNDRFRLPVGLMAAALCIGGLRFQAQLPAFDERDLAWYAGADMVKVTGRVISFPERSSSSTTAILAADSIEYAGHVKPVRGKLELRLPGGFHLSYGDSLSLEGDLNLVSQASTQPYSSYLARRGIYGRMAYPQMETIQRGEVRTPMAWIYALRQRALELIYTLLPFPESSLLAGILLGIDWVIPDYLRDAYRASGVLHIIAISGFNLALISGLTARLTRRLFNPIKAAVSAIAVIVFYSLLVGAEPAVVRAAIMGSLAIPAHLIGRRVIALHSLVIVAAIMLLGNPFLLWDLSFQLSFLACLGLITMVDPILRWCSDLITLFASEDASRNWQPILTLLVSTLCAQFSVLPVSLKLDAQASLFSLPANMMLLPVQPILMALGGLAVLAGLLLPPIGQLFAYAVWPFLAYCNRIALQLGFLPGSEVPLPDFVRPMAGLLVFTTLLAFSIWHIRCIARPDLRERP